jgi:hypothetical protein
MEERYIKVLIALFVVVVCVVIGYTFSQTYEKFENAPDADSESKPIVEDHESDTTADDDKNKNVGLTSRERELFSQIVSEKISNDALEKLIKAGQITESMVEKFLNEIDKEGGDIVEGFSSTHSYSAF